MTDRIPWEYDKGDLAEGLLGAWFAHYPGHGTYCFVGGTETLTFTPEGGDHTTIENITDRSVYGNMPGAAAEAVRKHRASYE